MASWSAKRGSRFRELDFSLALPKVFPDISLEFDSNEFARLTQEFSRFPGAVRAAALYATEKTRKEIRNEFVKGFTRLVTLQAAYIRRGVTSRQAKASNSDAKAEIRIATGIIPLSRYEMTPQTPPVLKGVKVKNRLAVRYRLRKAGKSSESVRSDIAPAGVKLFVQRMQSGHTGAFFRLNRKKIREDYGPALQYHAYAEGFLSRIEELSQACFRVAFIGDMAKLTAGGKK